MKILVIRLTSMGDVILTTPLFSFLKIRYPDSSITFITDPAYEELFSGDPRLVKVIAFRKNGTIDDSLLKTEWDLVIDLQNNHRSAFLTGRLTICNTKGVFNKYHLKRLALLFIRVNRYRNVANVPGRYIEAAGLSVSPADVPVPRLYFDINSRPRLKELLDYGKGVVRPSIALFPFSAWKNKEWPEDHFAKVGRFFHTKGWNVLIMGGHDDEVIAEDLRLHIGQRCRSLAGKVSLYECGCLFTRCSLALGVDTGLSHLARSCGVKTGIIFGPTTRHFGFYPYGEPIFRVFEHPFFCRPCHPHGGNICILNRQCLNSIKPDAVIRGLQQMVQGSR